MSEKLRNENLGESQREEMVQRDVQSPSASKFDDKKEFFENVSTQKENVPNEEILTEQKKEICEDLKSIGQNQKEGKTFDDKKEFFESISSEQPQDTLSQSQNKPESQKELLPKEEWRNKNEGERKSPIDSPLKQEEGKERLSQKKEDCRNENEKEKSFGRDEKDVPSQSGVSSMMQGQQGSLGNESPMKQMKEEKESPFQQKGDEWKNKNEKEKSFERDEKDVPSQSGVSSMMQGQQSSLGNESPMKQMKEEKESPFQQKGEEWKNKNEKESERKESPFSQYTSQLGSSPMTQGQQGQESSFGSGVPSMMQGQQGNEGSFRTGSPMSQGKDTSYGSLLPNEKSSSLQGDLMNFGQQNEWEKQRSIPQEQNLSFQSGDSSMIQSTGNQQFLGLENESPKDKSDYHPHPRIKGFEPKDPLQSKKEFETENKDNK